MPSTCPHCGIGFNKWEDYNEHLTTHRVALSHLLPVNHSGRSKAQIVDEAERSWLAPYLISTVYHEHLGACKCSVCLNKRLDALIAEQEAALNQTQGEIK